MKPDKPGIWYSRSGDRIGVWRDGMTGLMYRNLGGAFSPSGYAVSVRFLKDDDWRFAPEPEFPPLPVKPALVYAETRQHKRAWWMVGAGRCAVTIDQFDDGKGYTALPKDLTVLPHPNNHPEAERLLGMKKRARKKI